MDPTDRDFASSLGAISPALSRAARMLCWSQADVDDVVQDTLLEAFRSKRSFRGNAGLVTWCYTILTRVAARANRRYRRAMTNVQSDMDQAAAMDAPLPPVDRRLVEDESARAMVDAVRALPERQREMITLHFLQDCSYAEIAESLGVSIGTVKATVFAAKQSLRNKLSVDVQP